MKRPVDPRRHGKAPKEVYTHREEKHIGNELTLEKLTEAWNDILSFHSQNNHRIIEGPIFVATYYEGFTVKYVTEWDNNNYLAEKEEWDKAIANYEISLAAWKKSLEEERNAPPQNIDQKIARAQERLQNLLAIKAKEPIPFPPD